jgi:hypothetical protein
VPFTTVKNVVSLVIVCAVALMVSSIKAAMIVFFIVSILSRMC